MLDDLWLLLGFGLCLGLLFGVFSRSRFSTRFRGLDLNSLTHVQRILVINLGSMKKVLHMLPMVYDLKIKYPSAIITIVVEEWFVDLLKAPEGIHVLPCGMRRWKALLKWGKFIQVYQGLSRFYTDMHAYRYDLIFNISRRPVARLLAYACQKSRGLLIDNYTGENAHPVQVYREMVRHNAYLYRDFLLSGIPQFYPKIVKYNPRKYVIFFHTSRDERKSWPMENWIALAKALARKDSTLTMVLSWGTAKEKIMCNDLANQMPNAFVPDAISFKEFFNIILQAKLIVGIDTGLTHLAIALNCPTLLLYTATRKAPLEGFWNPYFRSIGDHKTPAAVSAAIMDVHALLNFNRHNYW